MSDRYPLASLAPRTDGRRTNRNLGQCSLRRKKRSGDPMAAFDGLPAPVRTWVAQAVLPWSAASVRRIWVKSQQKGLSVDDALAALSRAEAQTLARDAHASVSK